MKISISSINSYLKKPLNLNQMIEAINQTEIEIEQIISSNNFDPRIIVGEIISIKKHPNADRLKLVAVKIDSRRRVEVVCGARNIALKQKVVLAQGGSSLPNGVKITSSTIRGIKSDGMLLSEQELGLSNDHTGIVVLPPSTTLGKKLCDIELSEDILDIKTQTNRWDHLSLVGVAREIAVFSPVADNSVIFPKIKEYSYKEIKTENVKSAGKCGRFILVKLRVKNNNTSPRWLVENLNTAGIKNINPVVDISNFIMLELGQPSHAYDAAHLQGLPYPATAATAPSKSLVTIDGQKRNILPHDLLICDDNKIIGLAGVMGASNSEVSAKTKEIILEVAQFDKVVVRKMAQAHNLRTEASARYERGLPLPLAKLAASRLIDLLAQICEAELIEPPTDALYQWPWVTHVGLKIPEAEKLLGIKLSESKIIVGLRKLGFEVEHFKLSSEASRYLGTPYKFGAKYKTDGISAFDCSYLTDYIYSKIGVWIGHTAKQQFDSGQPVHEDKLRAGDLLFYSGHWDKLKPQDRGDIGHCGMYIGKNKVLTAAQNYYDPKSKSYKLHKNPSVMLVSLTDFINNPSYKGARRYCDNFNHTLAITAPWWRNDISSAQDIVEEIAKLVGLNNIPTKLPTLPPIPIKTDNILNSLMRLRYDLAAIGMYEVMTYSFVSKESLLNYGLVVGQHLEVQNPLTINQQYLRSNLLPSFLDSLTSNYKNEEFNWFEISKTHHRTKANPPVAEHWQMGMLFYNGESLNRALSFLSWLMSRLRLNLDIIPSAHDWFYDGRSAKINYDTEEIGMVGQINASLLPKYAQDKQVSFLQLKLDKLLTSPIAYQAPTLLDYQLVSRDITFELPKNYTWAKLKNHLNKFNKIMSTNYLGDYNHTDSKKRISVRVLIDFGPNPSGQAIEKYVKKMLDSIKV